MLRIPYDTDAFPTGTVANGYAELSVTWDDVLWAAVTVGRPNRHYVFRHGAASMYEALFRWSLVRMALEQSGPRGLGKDPNSQAIISADIEAAYGKVVRVIDILKTNGVERFAVQIEKEEKK